MQEALLPAWIIDVRIRATMEAQLLNGLLKSHRLDGSRTLDGSPYQAENDLANFDRSRAGQSHERLERRCRTAADRSRFVRARYRLRQLRPLIATQVILHGVGGHVYECACANKAYQNAKYEYQNGFHLSLSESEDPAPRSLARFSTIVPLSKRLTVSVPTVFSCCWNKFR